MVTVCVHCTLYTVHCARKESTALYAPIFTKLRNTQAALWEDLLHRISCKSDSKHAKYQQNFVYFLTQGVTEPISAQAVLYHRLLMHSS
jgi:hypothetical protein